MTELMKRYEAETGNSSTTIWRGECNVSNNYIEWLEAQLTWRPVTEKPTPEIEEILCKRECRFNGKDFTRLYPTRLNEIGDWEHFVASLEITTWLPIPPMKEGM